MNDYDNNTVEITIDKEDGTKETRDVSGDYAEEIGQSIFPERIEMYIRPEPSNEEKPAILSKFYEGVCLICNTLHDHPEHEFCLEGINHLTSLIADRADVLGTNNEVCLAYLNEDKKAHVFLGYGEREAKKILSFN